MLKLEKPYPVQNISDTYLKIAEHDEYVAEHLLSIGMYQHAMYFTLQAMEKQIRSKIFTIINPELESNRNANRHHSLTDAIDLLIQVSTSSSDPLLRESMRHQLIEGVLHGINYQHLHNNLRYPHYVQFRQEYRHYTYDRKDAELLIEALQQLKQYLQDMHRM